MSSTDTAGYHHRVYAAGRFLSRDPVPVQLQPQPFSAKTRTSNGSFRQDRLFIDVGFPNVIRRDRIICPYPNVTETGLLDHLNTIAAIGQPFDVCVFKQEKDVFNGDGTLDIFYLQRAAANTTLIALEGSLETTNPECVARVERYSAAYGSGLLTPTAYTVSYKSTLYLSDIINHFPSAGEAWIEETGHISNGLRISMLRVNPAPVAGSDVLVVTYVPLYRVILGQDSGRTFALPGTETRSLVFEEI